MQLIDRHALLKNVYDNPPEKARMTQGEWCRKCIYEAPTIEAEPVRHGRWIPVEDALPDALQNVLVCTDINTVTIAWINGDGWTFADTGNGHTENWSFADVKYWMHLPLPPKGEQK